MHNPQELRTQKGTDQPGKMPPRAPQIQISHLMRGIVYAPIKAAL